MFGSTTTEKDGVIEKRILTLVQAVSCLICKDKRQFVILQ